MSNKDNNNNNNQNNEPKIKPRYYKEGTKTNTENKVYIEKLAIHGGKPIRTKPFPRQKTIGLREIIAVVKVMLTKRLSYFRGNWIPEFHGGPQIQALEKEFSYKFNVKHSISVNSCTSALQIACLAIGLKKGDEVLVTPWSMSCSATAPLVCGAKPVFVDIDKNTFMIDPKKIEEKITKKTKAIIVVDLFGQIYPYEIDRIAKKHGLYIIEDAAQAIGATRKEIFYAGTCGHIGCFSFTQGKHLTSGEGGMLVTNDDDLALKAKLIRNHAEAVVGAMKQQNVLSNYPKEFQKMYGFNLRLTEIQAAIIRIQLKRLNKFIKTRQKNAKKIENIFDNIIPPNRFSIKHIKNNTHAYYVLPLLFNCTVDRNKYINALNAELCGGEIGRPDKGNMFGCGYIKPLNTMPIFNQNAEKDTPVAYKLWKEDLIVTTIQQLELTDKDIRDIQLAVNKIRHNIFDATGIWKRVNKNVEK